MWYSADQNVCGRTVDGKDSQKEEVVAPQRQGMDGVARAEELMRLAKNGEEYREPPTSTGEEAL